MPLSCPLPLSYYLPLSYFPFVPNSLSSPYLTPTFPCLLSAFHPLPPKFSMTYERSGNGNVL